MNVGRYDCKRNESESELDNQLSGHMILRKENKQTCILVCLCMYVCMRSESESGSHPSPPQLKGVRVISPCARVCVRDGTSSLISLLCLFVCRVHTETHTHTHKQTTLKTQTNTCQVMIENQHVHSSTVSQDSVTRNTHSLKR